MYVYVYIKKVIEGRFFMWIGKIFRSLFLFIDLVIYWAIELVYRLFLMISETGIFTPESIREFSGRIYVLLGVFMLFKVSFSLITYILNPDDMMDKSKGMGKLVTNFFVVLIGIVAVPYVFQAAYSLQSIILKENVIGSIIMGQNAQLRENNASDDASDVESNYIKRGGELMSFTTLSAFIRLNPDIVGQDCSDRPVVQATDTGANIINPACDTNIDLSEIETDDGNPVSRILIDAYSSNDTKYLTSMGIINLRADNTTGDEDWLFNYTYIISSIAGGFMAWILMIFCIDIAVRSVKLGFLQLIAPIPIISYIDPKSGKDGVFKKWVNECVKTYVDVFVRLIAIYFALYVITIIVNGSIYNITTGAEQRNIFVIVFIIFGALMFAKQLPDLISNILGVKLSGGFTLNPMKKLGQSPFAAGAMGLVGGAVGGMAANTWALGRKIHEKGWKNGLTDGFHGWRGAGHVAQNLFTGAAGAFSAGRRGLVAGATSGGKGSLFDGAKKGIKDSNQARYNRDVYAGDPGMEDTRYGWGQRRLDDIDKFAGVKNKDAGVGKYDKQMKDLKRLMDNYQGQENALRESMARFQAASGASFTSFDARQLYQYDADGNIAKDGDGHYMYVDYASYQSNGGTLNATQFDEFRNYQRGIDYYDVEYEKARRQYGKYEDAYKTREAAKKE